MSISLFRFLPAAALIAAGLAMTAVSVCGVFRIRYVLNRLHAAAIGDSLGLPLIAAGLAILFGFSAATAKILCIVALFWLASPVCSHLLASLEASTNEHLSDDCEIVSLPDAGGDTGEGREP